MTYQLGEPREHGSLKCRGCARPNNAATPVTHDTQPRNGNAAVCFYCGEVSVYVVGPLGLAMREPTMTELAEIMKQHGPLLRELTRQRATRRPS